MLNEETFIDTESDVVVKKLPPLQTANNVCMNIQCVGARTNMSEENTV
jgi:hypothetical protein